ncbi:MAG TPA: Uma2 family endonuclease [Polyangiaceae bacterium]|nr:Uma2 family endonuclease [Polyangiaceae bacterium]
MIPVQQAFDPARWGGKAMPGQDELPCSDGEPMETLFHDAQDALLKDTLIEAWAERRDFFVGGNCFVCFSAHQLRSNDFRGPDVLVVLDVDGSKERKSWVAWEEGGRLPDVVIEVTSESTAHVDRGEKMRIYSQIWRTSAYFIFDPETEQLEGFERDSTGRNYVPLPRDDNGDFTVAALGLKLGLRQTAYRQFSRRFVRWLDTAGQALPTARERAETERTRAETERTRADAERTRADAERTRAETERTRADAERTRADELQARLRALEEK